MNNASIPKHHSNYGWEMKTVFSVKSGTSKILEHSFGRRILFLSADIVTGKFTDFSVWLLFGTYLLINFHI